MPLLDIFKKKKKTEEKIKKVETREKQKKVKSEITHPRVQQEKIVTQAYRFLKTPHVTEKATSLSEKNQYVFKVWSGANKIEIKKAIENLYGVDVLAVRIIKIPKKQRMLGRISGWRKSYKKAIVKIKEGQKIEVLPR